ncbi:NACHT domain-containing protein [Streptosporangium soli]|nr:NACHT domain-containing protein [Streptosporangium sp. KLBMP 9127]
MKVSVIAHDNNVKGDLLTRLSADLFHSLGYEDFIFDTAKSGRELDVSGTHRYEPSKIRAECKASKGAIGGSDINKFVGVLDAERRGDPSATIHGYFISLGGFRSSVIAQEADFTPKRIVLIDSKTLTQQLVTGGVVVDRSRAIESVARLCESRGVTGYVDPAAELLAHEHGWIWAIYIRHGRLRTHVTLVHADGQILAREICEEILSEASVIGHESSRYSLLNLPAMDSTLDTVMAEETYRKHLRKECDAITLEGLPADHEVGARSFSLKDLYVDMQMEEVISQSNNEVENDLFIESQMDELDEGTHKPEEQISVGRTLQRFKHVAILGLPGAGKTTLLKHLAVSYASSTFSRSSSDPLPAHDWLPLVIRCRHLGDLASRPISEVIHNVAIRAEMPELADAFYEMILARLREGKVLLLVDGLDEIRMQSARQAFVTQLRTFLSQYPNSPLIITSRETGYKAVAGAIRSFCHPLRVSPLSEKAIVALTLTWHRHVVGPGVAIQREAQELASGIIASDRVLRLATNPLMLTTLLLVRRWMGQLPRRRSVLYRKAIEVLLMTWNVEGHEPLDQEEVLPQLSYAAYCMMSSGATTITAPKLKEYITQARRDLPEVLAYTSLSVTDFLNRVEERSSLLTVSGVAIEHGSLVDVYEFKHLTFQEYLAALAIAEGHLPQEFSGYSLVDIIGDRFVDDSWRETVALSAVLSRRGGATDIVKHLINLISRNSRKNMPEPELANVRIPLDSLMTCLTDEVPITPEVAREAIDACLYFDLEVLGARGYSNSLTGGRYASVFRDACLDALARSPNASLDLSSTVGTIYRYEALADRDSVSSLPRLIKSDRLQDRLYGVASLAITSYYAACHPEDDPAADAHGSRLVGGVAPENEFKDAITKCIDMFLGSSIDPSSLLHHVAVWALCWGCRSADLESDTTNKLRNRAVELWMHTDDRERSRLYAWLVHALPLDTSFSCEMDKQVLVDFMREQFKGRRRGDRVHFRSHETAVLVLAYLLDVMWDKNELVAQTKELLRDGDTFTDQVTTLKGLLLSLEGESTAEVAAPSS